MNHKTELGIQHSAELDLSAGTSNSKANEGLNGDRDIELNPKAHIGHDASSSEPSIPSEPLTGLNGETLHTTDSDCRGSPVAENQGNTSRTKSRKRKPKAPTPGYTKDWESNDSWTSEKAQEDCTVVAEEIETKRRKIKSLQQKNRRLKFRHSRLKAAIKEMKANMADRHENTL